LENLAPDSSLFAHAEQGAVGQDHRHAAGSGRHGFDHVLHPGVVAAFAGRHAGEVAAVGVAGPDLVAPLFEGERRIGDDAVKGGEVVAEKESGQAEGVAPDDLEIRRAVQEEVHPGDGGGGEVFSWPKSLPQSVRSSPWLSRTWWMASNNMPPVPQVGS
jgi:hypothetical protein